MIYRYVKPLATAICEAATPAQTAYDAVKKKYEDAGKKDQEQYKQYADGKINRDQYMSWFNGLLEIEREYRLAQINFKLESGRVDAQQTDKQKPPEQQKPELPGTQAPPVKTEVGQ